jgi:hypothetical protein
MAMTIAEPGTKNDYAGEDQHQFTQNRKSILTPFKTEFILNIYKFSPYLAGNTLGLRYRDQPVNAV